MKPWSSLAILMFLLLLIGCGSRGTISNRPHLPTPPIAEDPSAIPQEREIINQMLPAFSGEQTLTYENLLTITIPASALDRDRRLTLSTAGNNVPVHGLTTKEATFVYQIKLDGKTDFSSDPIRLKLKYNSSQLNQNISAYEQLQAVAWNEEKGLWIELPSEIDISEETITIFVDHLSLVGYIILGGGSTAYSIDIYSADNFKVIYSKQEIESHSSLNNQTWVSTTFSAPKALYSFTRPSSSAPFFVQDIASLFEKAFINYISAGFANPLTKVESSNTDKKIMVRLASKFSGASAEELSANSPQSIILYLEDLVDFSSGKPYILIARKLFAKFQQRYYSSSISFLSDDNAWWLAATAEYAANRLAWRDKATFSLYKEVAGSDYLSYSLATTGKKSSFGWYSNAPYEQATANFIEFLIEDADSKPLISFIDVLGYVANNSPIPALESYFYALEPSRTHTLLDYYSAFVYKSVFSNNSFLAKYNLASFANNEQSEVCELQKILQINEKNTIGKIKITGSGNNRTFVALFAYDKLNQRFNTFQYPLQKLYFGDEHSLTLNDGDLIYCFAINTDSTDRSLLFELSTGASSENNTVAIPITTNKDYTTLLMAIKVEKVEADMSAYYDFSDETIYKFYVKGKTGNLPLILNPTIPSQLNNSRVRRVAEQAFSHLALTSVFVPDSVTRIEKLAFAYNNIEEVTFGSGLENIDETAFAENKLHSITFPENIRNIGRRAFKGNLITSITFKGNVPVIAEEAFSGNSIGLITFYSAGKTIPNSLFDNDFLAEDLRIQYEKNGAGTYKLFGTGWVKQ